MTRPYAEVIGDPIAQSKSPLIHNFWLGKLGIDAEYRACHVRAEELADYFAQRRGDAAWQGCNVTMPHKQAIIPLLDALDPLTERVGAVNTVVRGADGTLGGYNTDVAGFLEPLQPLPERDRDGCRGLAIVIGAGGAARAVVSALYDEGYQIDIINRDAAKARSLALEFGAPVTCFSKLELPSAPRLFTIDPVGANECLLINTTSLGMVGHPPLAITLENVSDGVLVYDIVTQPLETPLLVEARARGMRTIDGLAMLIGQAAVAFEKFFEAPAPRQHEAELRELLTQ